MQNWIILTLSEIIDWLENSAHLLGGSVNEDWFDPIVECFEFEGFLLLSFHLILIFFGFAPVIILDFLHLLNIYNNLSNQ